MKEMKRDETRRDYSLIRVLGVMMLALLMLVSIAGAAPFAYVVDGWLSGNVGEGRISVIDTTTNEVTAKVPGYFYGPGVAVNPTGTKVYVTNEYDVSVIDATTNTVTATVPVVGNPVGVAVNPDGKKVYVTSFTWTNWTASNGTVSVIETATNTVTATVKVGSKPWGVAVNPAGQTCT